MKVGSAENVGAADDFDDLKDDPDRLSGGTTSARFIDYVIHWGGACRGFG